MTVLRLFENAAPGAPRSLPARSRAVEGSASQQGKPRGAVVAFLRNGGPASSLMDPLRGNEMQRLAKPARSMRLSGQLRSWVAWSTALLLGAGLMLAPFVALPD